MAEVTEGYMPYLGYETYWRVVGNLDEARERGVAPLVLLHGGPGSGHDYFEVLDELAHESGRPLVMYDQLGCGKSFVEGRPGLWHAETWVNELEALLGHLGIEHYHLLGQSWGGMLAITFACDRTPAGLRSLVLSSTLSSSQLWGAEQHRMVAQLPEAERAAIAEADATGNYASEACLAATAHYMQLHCCDAEPAADAPECLRRAVRKGKEPYEVAWGPNEFTPMGTLATWDYTEKLKALEVPALVISGTDDLCTPLVAKTMYDAIPRSRWELMAGARHMCFVDAHDAYVKLVRTWCAECD